MVTSVAVLMGLLGLGFLGTKIASALRIPHSVLLVIIGVAAGSIMRTISGAPVDSLVEAFPEIILYVLLPPLVFESAYNFDFHEFKRDLVPITSLAVISLIVSTILVGLGLSTFLRLPLVPCLVFGALISSTDPVAVVALFKEIGAPKRLTGLVEGESLLNDGTAIVMFRVMLGFMAVPVFNAEAVAAGVLQFVVVAAGGVLVGLAIAGIISFVLRLTASSASAQLGLTVVAAYLSFLVADHVFHVSGVISTMTVGLFLGSRARLTLGKEALQGMGHVWEFMALAANIIVFFGVGLTIDPAALWKGLAFLPATLAIIYVVRFLSVFTVVPVVNATKAAKPVSAAYQAVLSWGGLRGGLAMALVLTLSADFPFKQLFLALAAAVVLSTLLVNALTIKPLMHLLRVDRLNPLDEGFYLKTLDLLGRSVFDPLVRAAKGGSISSALVEEKRAEFGRGIEESARAIGHESTASEEVDLMFGLYSLLLFEKRYYDEAMENGIISRQAYVRLCRSVMDRKLELEQEGRGGLERHDFGAYNRRTFRRSLRRVAERLFGPSMAILSLGLEIPLHRLFAIQDAEEKSTRPEAKGLARRWCEVVREEIAEFYAYYPNYGIGLQSAFIADTVRAASASTIDELTEAAIISDAVSARARQNIAARHAKASAEARILLRPSVEYLLGRVPLFRNLPPEVLAGIAKKARRIVVAQGSEVVREGASGSSFFLVTAGFVEVVSDALLRQGIRPKLFIGDYFGEMSLVFNRPRTATVVAARPSELVEIGQAEFEEILKDFPELRSEIREMAEKRLKELMAGGAQH
jgi:CPA1 family monovalent cation:H+ antiporter